MDVRVSIDEKAKDVIKVKGHILAISRLNIENCCVPIGEVIIHFKKPEHEKLFHKILVENITIYIDKSLDFKNNLLRIKQAGIGRFRTVRIEGVVHF